MHSTYFQSIHFLTSVAELKQLPADIGKEVAFVGRSNAGKSSAINLITGKKGLAHTSKTPGRTQLINFFAIDDNHRLVDLPGYGYAKVSQAIKTRFDKTLSKYLAERDSLKGLILIMDIRHPMKEFDQQMLAWVATLNLPVHILLTKTDKLNHQASQKTLKEVQQQLQNYTNDCSIQLFSSLNKIGLKEAQMNVVKMLDSH